MKNPDLSCSKSTTQKVNPNQINTPRRPSKIVPHLTSDVRNTTDMTTTATTPSRSQLSASCSAAADFEQMFLDSATHSSLSPNSSASSSPPSQSSYTEENYHDFCSRSLNLNARSLHRHQPEDDDDDDLLPGEGGRMRPRTYSLPATHVRTLHGLADSGNVWRDVYTCPVRSFSRTHKGVVNRGDSVRKCSINSLLSSGSAVTDLEERHRALSIASQDGAGLGHCGGVGIDSGVGASVAPSYFRVAILGTMGVGKSALCRQFMSSEYLGTYVTHCDNEEGPAIVSVIVDGEEAMIEFTEGPTVTQEEDSNFDAYIIVFSVTDRASFDVASFLLRHLRVEVGTDRSIILVANKVDLVRQRRVTNAEAREVASTFDSKYTETSAALNDHVDDLLVGTLSQIRLRLCPPPETLQPPPSSPKTKCRTPSPLSLFSRIVKYATRKSNSCDNLLLQ